MNVPDRLRRDREVSVRSVHPHSKGLKGNLTNCESSSLEQGRQVRKSAFAPWSIKSGGLSGFERISAQDGLRKPGWNLPRKPAKP